jgi:hypothetical protein
MPIPDDLLESLMKDFKNPEDLIGETGLLEQLTKQLLERAMQAEMTGLQAKGWAGSRTCKRFCVNSSLGPLNDRHSIFKNDSKLIQG